MLQDANITMKDGAFYSGPLWQINAKEGWIFLSYNYDRDVEMPDRIYLRDIDEAVWKDQEIHAGVVRDMDLLERARYLGWDGI